MFNIGQTFGCAEMRHDGFRASGQLVGGWIWPCVVACHRGDVSGRMSPPAICHPPRISSTRQREEFFEARVRPVLASHCLECHGAEKHKGGLRLDGRDAMLRGGETGRGRRAGQARRKPADRGDPLWGGRADAPQGKAQGRRDRRLDPVGQARRALARAALSASVARTARHHATRRPIQPPHTVALSAQGRAFWSLQPVQNPAPPPVQDDAWPGSPIDRFILAKLEQNGLTPAPPADKPALIRRASFDLIGLPPTPQEIDAFIRDDAPTAFARVVDRLLASPHYGERWGRYWLDVARYGEDQAHSFQPRLYPNGFRYRDWLVRALNRDLPYDQFIIEQIAGDLIEGSRATRSPGGPGLLRVRAGLLRRLQEIRPVRRSHRHPDPRFPGPDGRLRPLPRPQVRPDPDNRLLRPDRRLRQHRVRGSAGRTQGARSRPTTKPRPRSRPRTRRSRHSSRRKRGG